MFQCKKSIKHQLQKDFVSNSYCFLLSGIKVSPQAFPLKNTRNQKNPSSYGQRLGHSYPHYPGGCSFQGSHSLFKTAVFQVDVVDKHEPVAWKKPAILFSNATRHQRTNHYHSACWVDGVLKGRKVKRSQLF